MYDMVVKSVDVLGDAIMATKDEKGHIWAGVSYFCNALGMSKGQKDRQTTNVQKDETLKRGCRKFEAGVFDPSNETIGMRIDFVPLWLAKINITPSMLKENPDLADKLLEYQLKAKDILAAAFLPSQDAQPLTLQQQIQTIAKGTDELYQRVDDVKKEVNTVKAEVENIKSDLPLLPIEADEVVKAVKKKGVEVMGGKQAPAYRNRSLRQRVYNDIYGNVKHNFNVKSYKAIRRRDVEKAIQIINEYKLPLFLKEQIEQENAQITMDTSV